MFTPTVIVVLLIAAAAAGLIGFVVGVNTGPRSATARRYALEMEDYARQAQAEIEAAAQKVKDAAAKAKVAIDKQTGKP